MLIPCRCSLFGSCTSLPLSKSRNLLHMEWAPVYHIKGWGKFNRHYGDFCTGTGRQVCLDSAHSGRCGSLTTSGSVSAAATRGEEIRPQPPPLRPCCKAGKGGGAELLKEPESPR